MHFIKTSGASGKLIDTWEKGGKAFHGPSRGLGPRNRALESAEEKGIGFQRNKFRHVKFDKTRNIKDQSERLVVTSRDLL